MTEIGELKPVSLSDIWPNEQRDFSPWLAEEIYRLGIIIGLELEVESLEAGVGRYSADILCREKTGGKLVLIENQYGETDHDHLGKIITYSSGLKTAVIIWISNLFTQEHKEAIEWLNENTKSEINFFGIEFKL